MSNELSSDQVRRELRELDRAHRDTIPGFRAALQRLFLSGEYGESDVHVPV